MEDDADLLASLVDGFGDDGGGDDECEQEDDAPPTTSEKSQHSVTSSCSFTDQANVGTDPSPMNDMMAQMAKMQQQIAMLQSQLQAKSSDSTTAVDASTSRQPQVGGRKESPATTTLFTKNQRRTARAGGAEQLSQQDARTPVSQARGSTNQTPSTHGVPRQASVTQKAAAGVGKSPHTQKATAPGKPSKADDSSTKEHFSGLHLLNPRISSSVMAQRMEKRRMFRLSQLSSGKMSESQLGDNWVTIGVIIKKSVKQSAKGSSYSIWTLSDLTSSSSNVSLFLFGKSHSEHWKESERTVVAILTPEIMDRQAGSDFAIKISEADSIMLLGDSRDAGYCKSVTKAGNKCQSIVNRSTCEFCEYHVQVEYRRQSAKRMECQGTSQKPQSKSIMERVIGRNNHVSYGGQTYGVPSKTTRDLQGVKTSGPIAKRSLHQMAVPNAGDAMKQVDDLRRKKPTAVTRATGQVMCSSAASSDVFKQMLTADSPGARLLRGAQSSDGSGNSGPNRTARDLLSDEDKAQGFTRTGLGRLPVENGLHKKRLKERQSVSLQSLPSSRPELGGKGQPASRSNSCGSSRGSVGQERKSAKPSGEASSKSSSTTTPSFGDAIRSSSIGSKRKSTSQDGSSKKRCDSSLTSLNSESVSAPPGGEAFCDDQMVLDDAFGEDNSLQRYVKTPAVKMITGGSSSTSGTTPTLGRGLSHQGNGQSPVGLSPAVLAGSSRISNEIHRKRQEDAKQRAVLAVQRTGGLVCPNPNEVPGKHQSSSGDSRAAKPKTSLGSCASSTTAPATNVRLSALMEISDEEAKKIANAKSTHYDEARLLELEEQERYFNRLERKEDMENKMKTVMEVKVKVVKCQQCDYTAESASKRCSTDHKEQLVWSKTMKRFFECEGCKHRETSYGGAWPTVVCRCGLSNYRRVSMFKEKSFKKPEFEWNSSSLLIRGPEQSKFLSG